MPERDESQILTAEEADETLRFAALYLQQLEEELRPEHNDRADALKRSRREIYLVVSPAGNVEDV